MEIKIIKTPISKSELIEMANEGFGDLVKAAVDVEQKIIALGGELHADEEVCLMEQENSKREHVWGINIYPKKSKNECLKFDSMINIKPHYGNRSRGVESEGVREKIRIIIKKLVKE